MRDTAVSSGVVKSAIDNDGAPSSSVIVSSPIPSFIVTLLGLLNVTVTVSSTSSTVSAKTAIGIFCVVTLGAKVIVPVPAV